MRKIGSFTPLWNQEPFIGPHFELLTQLDRNVVCLQDGPLPQYKNEHGYDSKPDKSEKILRKYFPSVEIYRGHYPTNIDFGAELYNEGLRMMQDCDIVLRLDPDMLWNQKDWERMISFIRETDFDCYRMNFSRDSINYYMTWDFDHGLKDAQEFDALGVDPKKMFTGVLDYPAENQIVFGFDNWLCHHFRGWQKPKSTPPDWHKDKSMQVMLYGDMGSWYRCPLEIRQVILAWKENVALID